ncbi:MAG: hypothetical protein J3Q66DRAFT_320564 [Benniella sp.]|nr:MAG: hypothetical protein J3Q66DRAFT_320564 [Benniella sp.]
MSYNYNNSSSHQDHSAPYSPTNSRPIYTNNGHSTYVNSSPNYISSPFDDDPIPPANNHNYNNYNEKNQTSYNNNSSYSTNNSPTGASKSEVADHYSQQPTSPSMTEKGGAAAATATGQQQTFGMQHQSNAPYTNHQHNFSSDSHYYNGYDEERPSLSNDTAPMRPYGDMETSEGLTRSKSGVTKVKYGKKKSKCLPCFPCIHSTCGRVTCCCCLLLILVVAALAIVIFTVFKLPSVDYLGMQSEPQFTINQNQGEIASLAVNFVANIQVKNPNPIGFTFESIVATAYYPNYQPSLGGGTLNNVEFPSKSTKTISFPISASYTGSQDKGYTVVKNILERCGLLGSEPIGLTINYDLKLSFKIIGITISPTIKNQHVKVDCPANIGDIAANLPGGVGSFQ